MKKLLAVAIMIIALFAQGTETLIAIGKPGNVKFHRYDLNVETFGLKNPVSGDDTEKLCVALGKSKLVIINSSNAVLDSIFSNEAVQRAFRSFFENSGAVILNVPNWSWMKSRSKVMTDYFATIGVSLPHRYSGMKASEVLKITPEFTGSWIISPIAEYRMSSSGHMGKVGGKWKAVVIGKDSGNAVVAIDDAVLGKGLVVINYAGIFFAPSNSPFIENLIVRQYGEAIVK